MQTEVIERGDQETKMVADTLEESAINNQYSLEMDNQTTLKTANKKSLSEGKSLIEAYKSLIGSIHGHIFIVKCTKDFSCFTRKPIGVPYMFRKKNYKGNLM